jgi:Na+/H+-translocating membrane pyrophosphatase
MKQLGSNEEEVKQVIDDEIVEQNMAFVSQLITDGASTFLKAEYTYVALFVALFSLIIIFTVEPVLGEFYTTIPFLIGAGTSVLSGYIGMQVAVRANVRTTKLAMESLDNGFKLAFKGGLVLGFTLVGLALLNLILLIMWYRSLFIVDTKGTAQQQLH